MSAPTPEPGSTWKDARGVEWRVVGPAEGTVRSVRVGSLAEQLIWPEGIPGGRVAAGDEPG